MRTTWSIALAFAIGASPVLLDVSHAQEAKARVYYAKRGVTPEQYSADEAACAAAVKKTYYDAEIAKINVPYQPGLAGAAAGGLAAGMERGRIKEEARKKAGECLAKKGYRLTSMTKSQLEIFNQLNYQQRSKAVGILSGGGNIAHLLSSN
jgi:hypothetical protein